MSGSELTELLDQVEGAIRDFSEELVQQLARRDELEFEKEVKNSFITVLIEVQNKQKEQRELMKKRRKEKGLSLQSSRIEKGSQMPLKVRGQPGTRTKHTHASGLPVAGPGTSPAVTPDRPVLSRDNEQGHPGRQQGHEREKSPPVSSAPLEDARSNCRRQDVTRKISDYGVCSLKLDLKKWVESI